MWTVLILCTVSVYTGLSEKSADDSGASTVKTKCGSACQSRSAAVSRQLLPQVSFPKHEQSVSPANTSQSKALLHDLASRCHCLFLTSFASATPSLKYSQRGAKGEVVATFGSVQGTRWAGSRSGVQLEFLEGPDHSLNVSYKYMFQRLRDIRNGK